MAKHCKHLHDAVAGDMPWLKTRRHHKRCDGTGQPSNHRDDKGRARHSILSGGRDSDRRDKRNGQHGRYTGLFGSSTSFGVWGLY